MIAANDYIQVKVVETEGFQQGENNLKEGEVVSIGATWSVNNIQDNPEFVVGSKVLFDIHKSLKHGNLWYLKANSVFGYEESK